MNLEAIQQVAGSVESLVTVAAVVVGGFWTYKLFVKERQHFPSAIVNQELSVTLLSTGHQLVHVRLRITNTGKVLLELEWVRCRVQIVEPMNDRLAARLLQGEDLVLDGEQEVGWPVLSAREWEFEPGEAEIEPGEKEWLDCEFILEEAVRVIVLYGYVRNAAKKGREIGWSSTKVVELPVNGRSEEDEGIGSGG